MAMIMFEKNTEECNKLWARVINRYPTVLVDVFETMGIAYSGELGATTAGLGDGLPYAVAVAVMSLFMRAVLAGKTDSNKTIKAQLNSSSWRKKSWRTLANETKNVLVALPSATGIQVSDVIFKILQLSCQFALVWSEVPYVTNWTFGVRNLLQIVHGSYMVCNKNYDNCFEGGFKLANAPLIAWRVGAVILEQCKIALPAIAASGVGLGAGIYTTYLLTVEAATGAGGGAVVAEASAAAGGTTLLGGVGVVLGASLASFIAAGVAAWTIKKAVDCYQSRQEIDRLLRKYGLQWDSDHKTIAIKFRQLFLRYHPDKAGEKMKDEFIQCRADYETLLKESELRAKKATFGTMAHALSVNMQSVLQVLVPMFTYQSFAEAEVELNSIVGEEDNAK